MFTKLTKLTALVLLAACLTLTPAKSQDVAEMALWNAAVKSGKVEQLKFYLSQYPNGQFADLTKLLIKDPTMLASSSKRLREASSQTSEASEVPQAVDGTTSDDLKKKLRNKVLSAAGDAISDSPRDKKKRRKSRAFPGLHPRKSSNSKQPASI